MAYSEPLRKTDLGGAQELIPVVVGGADHVGGERRLGGGQGPDVQVMHPGDARKGFQVGPHLARVDVLGRRVEGQVQGAAHQIPGSEHDDGGDDQADGRIDPGPVGQADDQGADNHAGGDGRVCGHVQEGAPGVEVVVPPAEHQGGGAVDQEAQGRDDHHRLAGDGLGGRQAPDRLPDNGAHGDQQQGAVGQGGQDGGLAQAVGPPVRRGPAGQGDSAPAQHQAEHVGEIVSGVGQQGEAVRPDPGDRLGDHEGEVQHCAYGVGAAEVGAVVMVVAMAMPIVARIVVVVMIMMIMGVSRARMGRVAGCVVRHVPTSHRRGC